ncbi:MAG: hypothetical protein DME42_02310 [Verrucomicrobia bacterium]|nr:MAG: hypothetical protein DME42_02310 [Verrucomicrobiota bacterium]
MLLADNADEQALLNFLRQPASFGEKAEIRQTHISIVALTLTHAYKIKKPVNLGFLDFSTREKRRAACEAEVRLNRRLSKDVYLGVLPIYRNRDGLHFGADGEVLEYAVQMRRLNDDGFLSWRLARDSPSASELERVVKKLGDFYRQQNSSPEIASWGRIDKLRLSTDENFAQTEQFVGDLISRPAFEALRRFNELSYERCREVFERRCAEGRILDCHGDLRCEHVHFSDAQVNIIDCIEFNDRFRYIDVANDIAFLAMDFDVRGHALLGQQTAENLADSLGDNEALRLLDFYKCYRACVRAKVCAIESIESGVAAEERERSRERAVRFFQFALRYAVGGSQPFVLVVMGRVGTGKSSVARALGEAFGAVVLSSDRIRKELAGVPTHERGDAAARAQLYSEHMTQRTYEELLRRGNVASTRDGIAVVDATFGKRWQRELWPQQTNTRYIPIALETSDSEIKQRLQHRDNAEISDARLEDFEMLKAAYEHPNATERTQITLVTSAATLESTITEILQRLIRIGAQRYKDAC